MHESEINDLLRGCREGNRTSQHRLYAGFYNYAMSIAVRYTGGQDSAAEVVNDTFFKVFTRLDRYSGEWPFRFWLRRILINTAIDHLRARQRLPIPENIDDVGKHPSVESGVVADLTREQILRAMHRLPPAYRTVFNLFVVDECTHEEISQLLGISVGASKSNLSRARQHLKQIFETEYAHIRD